MIDETVVFDLDGTICKPNLGYLDTPRRYGDARPVWEVIVRMRLLREKGYRIIIHTSRRMLTWRGNLEDIEKDVRGVTKDWLARYAVPYDELIFGKPYSSTYYVDDKAMNVSDFVGEFPVDISSWNE